MAKPKYDFKIPEESSDYSKWSRIVVKNIREIIEKAINKGNNKIFIRTNLKSGLPLENINKVAGPFVEAWALEHFQDVQKDSGNPYSLINVEQGKRLDPFDIILQFKRKNKKESYLSSNIDVKATSEDIKTSGKSPNITSYGRIRTEYVNDADYIFIILSLKHKVYSTRDEKTLMTNGIMEVTSSAVYDLKYLSNKDLNYNPALGTGQLQVRDIHYVTIVNRSTWEFCQLLDKKYINSRGVKSWENMAKSKGWIK